MSTLVEFMTLSGGDNRPPMLEKHLVTKDLWEKVQLLMQGTSLTKQERECKLYDAFDKFAHIKGESLHLLPPEWSKFVTDVKLVRDLYTTKFDQLYAYLEQHKLHANKVHSGQAVPVFKQGDDQIDAINKMMSFLSTVITSRFLTTNNQLRNSSNPRQQETIHDGMVTVQPVQGRGNNSGQQRVVKCFNCQREGHTELEFLTDLGVAEGPVTQTVITHNAAYQADDLDAYDSDCDDFSTAKAVLMANLSSYRSDYLSEVPHFENTHNNMVNQSVQEMPYSEQTNLVNYPENEITSDSNIIPYSQYLYDINFHSPNDDSWIWLVSRERNT
ncbi:hypothetical protein Tco_0745324 [Tanacetum coccineum]